MYETGADADAVGWLEPGNAGFDGLAASGQVAFLQ